jgi:hypothetical protein
MEARKVGQVERCFGEVNSHHLARKRAHWNVRLAEDEGGPVAIATICSIKTDFKNRMRGNQ